MEALDHKKIQDATTSHGVEWHFNPPLAPHFSGVHEIMIKAAKKAIYAILGSADITDEELWSAVVGAEGLINSVRQFWHRWLQEWIPSLSARKRWRRDQVDLKVGDVIVMFPDTPREKWPLGRIAKVFSGKDSRVRVVDFQVGRAVLRRPIVKLCLLERC